MPPWLSQWESVHRKEGGWVAAIGHQTQEDFSPSSLSEDSGARLLGRVHGDHPVSIRDSALSPPSLCTCWRHWARCPPCRDCEPHCPVAGGPFPQTAPHGLRVSLCVRHVAAVPGDELGKGWGASPTPPATPSGPGIPESPCFLVPPPLGANPHPAGGRAAGQGG